MGDRVAAEEGQMPAIEALSLDEAADQQLLELAKRDWGLIRKSASSGWE